MFSSFISNVTVNSKDMEYYVFSQEINKHAPLITIPKSREVQFSN